MKCLSCDRTLEPLPPRAVSGDLELYLCIGQDCPRSGLLQACPLEDERRVAEDREKGFATAAEMVRKLVDAWNESQDEIARLQKALSMALNHWDGHPEAAYKQAQGTLMGSGFRAHGLETRAESEGDMSESKVTPQDYVHTEANARLWDAAPDLLAALEHAMVCDFPDEIDFRCDGCEKARAAIAKARGQS